MAARIEAPQRGSTRSVYEAKWSIFTKWCLSNQVDFRAPPLKSIADFLLYLFQDRKLQPGTIDGYRSTVRFKRENPDLSLLDLKFRNMQGFGANMEISFMKYGSFMQKFAPFETFVKIT